MDYRLCPGAPYRKKPGQSSARKVEIQGKHAVVERLNPNGYERVRAPLPAVVIVSNEVGEMRYPTMIQRREAKKKPVKAWGATDIGFEGTPQNRLILKRLFAPQMRQARVQGTNRSFRPGPKMMAYIQWTTTTTSSTGISTLDPITDTWSSFFPRGSLKRT